MSETPYIPFYTSDFLNRTGGMTAAAKGVFITLVCHMHETVGPLKRDDARLSRLCGCQSRAVFKKHLDCLISEGVITSVDGEIEAPIISKWIERKRKSDPRPSIPVDTILRVFEHYGNVCFYCGDESGPFEIDHVFPWSRGGDHSFENLVVACRSCNRSKGAKTLGEWEGRAQ